MCVTDRRPRPRLSRVTGRNQNHPMTVASCVPRISLVKDHPSGSSRCMHLSRSDDAESPRESLMARQCGTDGSTQMAQGRAPHIPTAASEPADRCEDANRRVQLGHRTWVQARREPPHDCGPVHTCGPPVMDRQARSPGSEQSRQIKYLASPSSGPRVKPAGNGRRRASLPS